MVDIYTQKEICAHPSCHWEVEGGHSGIEARYENGVGEPSCYTHRDQTKDIDGAVNGNDHN